MYVTMPVPSGDGHVWAGALRPLFPLIEPPRRRLPPLRLGVWERRVTDGKGSGPGASGFPGA